MIGNGNAAQLTEILKAHHPEELESQALSLEEIFVASQSLAKEANP